MSVTTYIRDGVSDCRELITMLVRDLAGGGSPVAPGTAAEHFKVVFPVGYDITAPPDLTTLDQLVILESTVDVDPFARDDPTVEDLAKDPWRIAFHTAQWCSRSSTQLNTAGTGYDAPVADTVKVNSLAIYVGTPSTLNVDENGDPTIGWNSTKIGIYTPLSLQGYPAAAAYQTWKYKTTYLAQVRDLQEPVGNMGAAWTNTFDPTLNTIKLQTAGQSAPSPTPPTPVYQSPQPWDGPDVNDANQLFVNKYLVSGKKANSFGGFPADTNYAYPLSYRITLTDHGVFIGCWGPDPEESGKGFSWLLVQRPVDKKLGIVRGLPIDEANPGNRPLFCVNSVNGQYWKFVVREHDNAVPSTRKDATTNTPDSGSVINPYQQQSLTENGEYVITFLNNLNSSRFKYADELDMIGTVSSDVVGGGSNIDVNVYSELDRRQYHALWSSGTFGTKMRIMVVNDIPSPNAIP